MKINQTPKIDTQDAQDPPHPQDPPDCQNHRGSQYTQTARDSKAAGDAVDP